MANGERTNPSRWPNRSMDRSPWASANAWQAPEMDLSSPLIGKLFQPLAVAGDG